MKKNRELLHKLLVKDSRIKPGYSDFDAFESHYFDSENNVKKIYDVIIVAKYKTGPKKGQVYYTKPIENFYKDYVCDLEWAKTTNYCVGGDKPEEQEYTPEEKTISTTQQQQNLVNKGYFIGTSGPNKNGVDGIPGKKTEYAQHALNSGIDSSTYNNIYKQQNPELTQTIENLFGKQAPIEIPDNPKPQPEDDSNNKKVQPKDDSDNKKVQVQKARVIKTIHPKNW
jgi:hypothetical protein